MFKTILAATDGSECSRKAIDAAAQLAHDEGARLVLCSVMEPTKPEYALSYESPAAVGALYEALRDEAEQALETGAERCVPLCSTSVTLREGYAAQEICRAATAYHADLIVVGSHGRKGFAHLFLGSVAEAVLRSAPVPVLVVRQTAAIPETDAAPLAAAAES